ncbi:MAG: DUF262 domain-containing HNH endonuclease family protein [Candidatus Nitrosoabyssus spongiisocia]|nr:MAG: DUF262 domain-containing HNH endonuclease family protein [Nitrosopumilaceae archaeon AB1(1)]
MDADNKKFHELIDSGCQFSIPIYQRTYNWTHKQCKRMFDDILKIGKADKGSHFMGSVAYVGSAEHASVEITPYQIIDGQQRLTTLMLLLAAMKDFLDKTKTDITSQKIDSLLFNRNHENTEEYYKLVLTDNDDETFKSILNNDKIKYSNNITTNFEFFRQQFSNNTGILDTVWNGIHNLNIVSIVIDKNGGDKPQEIFEGLNSTGLDFSTTDLIRNYVLMRYDTKKQKKIYKEFWRPMEMLFSGNDDDFDEFIRNYLMVQKKLLISKKNTYDEFKEYTKDLIMDIEIKNIYKYSKYYAMIIYGNNDSDTLEKYIANIRDQGTNVAHSLLLKVLVDHADEKISFNDVVSILSLVDSYLVRGFVCNTLSKGANKRFPELLNKIIETDYVKSIEKTIMINRSLAREFPRDSTFREKLERVQLYSNITLCRYILFRLEHEGNNEIVDSESLQIEHIMPQTLTEEWERYLGNTWKDTHEKYLHTIGNLTLTGHNQKIGNIIFAEKKKEYEKSHLKITKSLCNYENWNRTSISERTKNLIEDSIKIWKCPEEPNRTSTNELDDTFEDDYLEGKEITDLWNKLKERILSSFNYIQFNMTKVYGSFTIISEDDKRIGFCGIMALKNKIYLAYHIKINDKILKPSSFVIDVSNVGRYYNMAELKFTIFTENDIDKAIINLRHLYNNKHK